MIKIRHEPLIGSSVHKYDLVYPMLPAQTFFSICSTEINTDKIYTIYGWIAKLSASLCINNKTNAHDMYMHVHINPHTFKSSQSIVQNSCTKLYMVKLQAQLGRHMRTQPFAGCLTAHKNNKVVIFGWDKVLLKATSYKLNVVFLYGALPIQKGSSQKQTSSAQSARHWCEAPKKVLQKLPCTSSNGHYCEVSQRYFLQRKNKNTNNL